MIGLKAARFYACFFQLGGCLKAVVYFSACVLFSFLGLGISNAQADCTSPSGSAGAITWNGVNAVIWCDGTNWNSLASGGGGSGITALTGEVTASGTGSVAATIATNAVTYAKIQQGTARSVLGVTGNATANYAPIQGAANEVLRVNAAGTGLTFGAVNLASTAAVTGNLPVANLNSGTAASATTFWRGDGTWATPAASGTLSGGTAGYLGVWTGATSLGLSSTTAGQQLVWDSTNHRLGIGTTGPVYGLDVGRSDGGIGWVGRFESTTSNNGAVLLGSRFPGRGAIQGTTNGGAVASLAINPDGGNVGIGTTGPGSKLHIENSDTSNGALLVRNTAAGGGSDAIWAGVSGASGRVLALHKTGGSGNIIEAYYDGGGGYSMRLALDNGGALWIAAGLTQNSDQRLKHDVETIPAALDKILALRGVSFLWNDKTRGEDRQLGVIAQEVEKVLPEAVTAGPDGMKSVSYTSLVGPLIEAVKDLKADNDNLRAQIKAANDNEEATRRDMAALRRDVEALKAAR